MKESEAVQLIKPMGRFEANLLPLKAPKPERMLNFGGPAVANCSTHTKIVSLAIVGQRLTISRELYPSMKVYWRPGSFWECHLKEDPGIERQANGAGDLPG